MPIQLKTFWLNNNFSLSLGEVKKLHTKTFIDTKFKPKCLLFSFLPCGGGGGGGGGGDLMEVAILLHLERPSHDYLLVHVASRLPLHA